MALAQVTHKCFVSLLHNALSLGLALEPALLRKLFHNLLREPASEIVPEPAP